MSKKDRIRQLLAEAEALLESIRYVYEIDSKSENYFNGFNSHIAFASRQKDLALRVMSELPAVKLVTYDIPKLLTTTGSIYVYRRNIFDTLLIELTKIKAILQSAIGEDAEEIETITQLIKSKLRSVTFGKPTNEKEVQNNVESLLIARNYTKGIDYDRESGRVKTGVKESVPDFNLDRLDLCIEIKLIKESTSLSDITEQINANINAYGIKYRTILFIIYDSGGKVQNEEQFKSNIVSVGRVLLEIVKH